MPTFNLFHSPDSIHAYTAGEVIFAQGSEAAFMGDVISGEVVLQRDGRELTRLGKGEIFGETGLINSEPHSVTAVAATDCQIAQISQRQFRFMVTETPNFAFKVMSTLAERLSRETAKRV